MDRRISLREREPGKYDIVIDEGSISRVLTLDEPFILGEVFALREECNFLIYNIPEQNRARRAASPALLHGLQPGG